jgi:oxygen-independent coproporphyrinogen-3 oxidase
VRVLRRRRSDAEILSAMDHMERVMLGMRLAEGMERGELDASVVRVLIDDGLVRPVGDRVVLTDSGRLLADAVIRRLVA